MSRLVIRIVEIKGSCPVYRVGDRIVLEDGYSLNLEETDALCFHSVASLLPYHIALYRGVKPADIGLARAGDKAYVQCLDPCEYTGGGTVVFEIEKQDGS